MTEPSARIILDSISERGDRLTTMEVVMHRFVLAEFNTHRKFSRNSASSRAIPVSRRLRDFDGDPAMPLVWPAEQAGMQGGADLEGEALDDAEWTLKAIHSFIGTTVDGYLERHADATTRLHKSVLNRYLEPFLWHKVVVSSTEWDNFFVQRCSPLAQPEMRVAAEAMRDAFDGSRPTVLYEGDWHMPYVQREEWGSLPYGDLVRVSAARCARVSYLTQDGKHDIHEDIALFDRLVNADPPHWSPLEHVATPTRNRQPLGNFDGWEQLRHTEDMR